MADFLAMDSELDIHVECKCGNQFHVTICYSGVEDRNERNMDIELMHVWSNHQDCPNCGKLLQIELLVWEYPSGFINTVDFDGNCKILNKRQIYNELGYSP